MTTLHNTIERLTLFAMYINRTCYHQAVSEKVKQIFYFNKLITFINKLNQTVNACVTVRDKLIYCSKYLRQK